jgi:hypothetical protein
MARMDWPNMHWLYRRPRDVRRGRGPRRIATVVSPRRVLVSRAGRFFDWIAIVLTPQSFDLIAFRARREDFSSCSKWARRGWR